MHGESYTVSWNGSNAFGFALATGCVTKGRSITEIAPNVINVVIVMLDCVLILRFCPPVLRKVLMRNLPSRIAHILSVGAKQHGSHSRKLDMKKEDALEQRCRSQESTSGAL
jgi:hypothetical protein